MSLLLDDFGLLSVLLHGARLVAQSLTLGGIGFMAVLARPLAGELGASGVLILLRSRLTLYLPDGGNRPLSQAPDAAPDVIDAKAVGLAPGAYRLRWQVLAIDGHITRGDIPFTVAP